MKNSAARDLAARVRAKDQAAVGRALSWVIDESAGYEELLRHFFPDAGSSHKI
ncbi:MAG: hypothetical protein HY551_02975, partial [Elusimicrobia bacterium]|nr:hypothetical protein [Elusimicrobiota bacterium]